jgi:exodeoxyribonuclease V alpha subunit
VLAGLVERVTFHNEENGFCVLRNKARGHRELVTVVGHAAVISAGEWATASGEWVNDRAHGQQFKARFLKTSEPTSLDGIEKYLGSGMIRGIGPVYAKKLVRAFGEKIQSLPVERTQRLRVMTLGCPIGENVVGVDYHQYLGLFERSASSMPGVIGPNIGRRPGTAPIPRCRRPWRSMR